MVALETKLVACLSDNYAVLLHDPETQATAVIDAPEAEPILAALDHEGWSLSHVFITHHHWDHTGAIGALKQATGARIIGPEGDAPKIEGLDDVIADNEQVPFGSTRAIALETPGHTMGQAAWWFDQAGVVFTGDTLFAMGCGRVFEGTTAQMWGSLDRLRQLPAETQLYCGHEYTVANAKFALTVDPNNEALKTRLVEVEKLRADGLPTLPTTIALENETNPFLRADNADVRAALGMQAASDVDVFAEVRRRKDSF